MTMRRRRAAAMGSREASRAERRYALAGMGASLEEIRIPCLDFLDSLWTGRAFCGHWADDAEDCEYTYYALLALGHLSMGCVRDAPYGG